MYNVVYDENMKYYLNRIKYTRLLTAEEEVELSKRIQQNGDKQAVNELVENNLKLVISIAKKYYYNEMLLSDLVQEGLLGLMRAAQKYDYKLGTRFSTYAVYWIKQAIKRAIYTKSRVIRLPSRQEEKLQKINYVYEKLQKEKGCEVNEKDVASCLKIRQEEISSLKNVAENYVRLDVCIDEKGNTMATYIADDRVKIDDGVQKEDLDNMINKMLYSLTDKERAIIENRFAVGEEGQTRMTLKQVAHKLHISPETVRQIEMRVMKKIRREHAYLQEYLCS